MKKVPSEGPRDANIVIVGESPGKTEVRDGRPFVGRAGKELDKQLKAAGIDRSKCFITNSVKYQPPGRKNAQQKFWWENGKTGQPSSTYIEGIVELAKDLKEIQPNITIALGAKSLWALCRLFGVTNWRGSVIPSKIHDGKVIVCLHPSFILRVYNKRPLLHWDLVKANEEAKYPEIRQIERRSIIYPSDAEIEEAVERLTSAEIITFDSEWYDPDTLACIGFTDARDWAICIPADRVGSADAYEAILDTNVRKIAQNAMFDVVNLRRIGLKVRTEHSETGERLIEDTMVGFAVNWADIGQKDLGTLTTIFTDRPYYKEDLKIWAEVGDRGIFWQYNCMDNMVTQEVWEKIDEDEFPMGNTRRAYDLSMSTFNLMADSALRGIRVDRVKFEEYRQKKRILVRRLEQELNDTIGWECNVRSPNQVAELIYDQLGVKERAKRTTKQEVLLDIAAQAAARNEVAERVICTTVVKIRQLSKHLSNYYNDKVVDPDGRVRFSWNMAGTKQGRLSASKTYWGSGFPIQQSPRETREWMIADEGRIFIIPDLEQAEARFVAYLSEDITLIEWLEQGLDIHSKLAEQMFGVPYDDVVREHAEGFSFVRYVAKRCRHALNYMMGYRTFKNAINKEYLETGIGATEAQTKQWRRQYLEIHPNLESVYWKWVNTELSRNSAITNGLGRRKRFIGRWGNAMLREAVSYWPQSTVADMTHLGLSRVAEAIPEARVLANMHDGSLIDVPEDSLDEAKEIIKDRLTIPIPVKSHEVVIPVEVKSGRCWG